MLGVKEQSSQLRRPDFYRRIIEHVFSPMHRGRLVMDLPGGESRVFGSGADGVHARLAVNDMSFFKRCVLHGDIGFGESYTAGEWDSDDVTGVVTWMIQNVENHPTLMSDREKQTPVNLFGIINKVYHFLRENSPAGSRQNIRDHYDLGNDFFRLFLDPSMMYSSAYFQEPHFSLQEAQAAKCDRLCRKLRLNQRDHVLEIGSGWGGFAVYAAVNYGCRVTTITISDEQYRLAKERVARAGLSGKVDVRMCDYREIEGAYDKVVSIEMIEAVGHKFYREYFARINRVMKKNGLLALQAILSPDHRYDSFRKNVDWIQKHIFPGSLLPSLKVIQNTITAVSDMHLVDYTDLTKDYARTLEIWRDNFWLSIHKVREMGFDEEFIRKWHYYWCYCQAAFQTRNIMLAQLVYSRANNELLA